MLCVCVCVNEYVPSEWRVHVYVCYNWWMGGGVRCDPQYEGAEAPEVVRRVDALVTGSGAVPGAGASDAPPHESLDDRLRRLINSAPVMLFMKGSKTEPYCKFSKQVLVCPNDACCCVVALRRCIGTPHTNSSKH